MPYFTCSFSANSCRSSVKRFFLISIITLVWRSGAFYCGFVMASPAQLQPVLTVDMSSSLYLLTSLTCFLAQVNEMFPSYTKLQGVVCIIITFYLMYNCEPASSLLCCWARLPLQLRQPGVAAHLPACHSLMLACCCIVP